MSKNKPAQSQLPFEKITVGLSTSALFDMRESDHIFRTRGTAAYQKHMIDNEDKPFIPGHAFALIETMRDINDALGETLFDIVLVSKNDIWTGARAVKSCYHYNLPFSGALFSNGNPTTPYLSAYGVDWLISTHTDDVDAAVKMGIAANTINSPVLDQHPLQLLSTLKRPRKPANENTAQDTAQNAAAQKLSPVFNRKLHFVWDLDRVVFGPESDDVFGEMGLDYYREHEKKYAAEMLSDGPFMKIAKIVGDVARKFPDGNSPIISSVLTARGNEAALRAMLSLRGKGIVFNGIAHFAGGRDKDRMLKIMREQEKQNTILFLDDSSRTIDMTSKVVASGLVPRDAGGIALGETRKTETPKAETPKAELPKAEDKKPAPKI